MRATLIYGAGDIRVEEVPDPRIERPTDAIVRVLAACICGSDLHPYHNKPATAAGATIGHEFVGVITDLGREVAGLAKGDVVIAPFVWSDNTCDFCRQGLQTSCRHGGLWNTGGVGGGQAEAVRVPQAAGTLVKVPVAADSALLGTLLPSLLTLSDVYCTGWHAAVTAGVSARTTVAVVGDGAVGLSAVLAARKLGAERIILMGRHKDRTDLGREFGATDVVAERGDEGVQRVLELTGGDGAHAVLEAVGYKDAYDTSLGVVRAGGVVSRVGVPQYEEGDLSFSRVFFRNVTLTGGVAPARAYIEELLPGVLDGTVEPGKVFDRTVSLDEVPDGYRAMNDRQAIKVMIRP
jgi:threonine dehydrogenase-like Zn-dependent dehydrogenase